MKRILTIIIALMIILTGCSKAKSNSQGSQVTDDKVIENTSGTEETQDVQNSNETANDSNSTDKENKSSDEQENEQNNDINNQYFFNDIAAKKQYTYKGTIWGELVVNSDNTEKTNDEGDVYVTAKLNISEVAELKKGKIFELDFSVFSEKNNTEEIDRKEYYWVTNDKIYRFNAPKNFDDRKYIKNGILDELGCVKALEESGELPDDDNTLLRCSNSSIKISDDTLRPCEITVNGGICEYSYSNSGNSAYEILKWKSGKGLVYYSWGYGAKKYGMRLDLVE